VFLLCISIEVAYAAAAPLSLKYLVDDAFVPKNVSAFFLILSILLGGALLNVCAHAAGDYSIGRLGGAMIRDLRTRLFDHVQRQPLSFYQRYRVGDLVARFASDMNSMEGVIRFSSPMFLKESFSIALGLGLLFTLEWKLTLAVLAGSSLMFIGPKLLQSRAETANSVYKEAQEQFSNTIDEMVKGHKTIKSLHQQHRFRELSRRHIQELFTFGMKLHVVNALLERIPLTALLALNGTMIGYGGYLIFHDEMSIGAFMAFFTLFLSVGQSASNLSFLAPNLIESAVSFRRVEELLDQPVVSEPSAPVNLGDEIGSIRMEGVTFGYSEDAVQLNNVSVTIPPGAYAAFVGPSGSGKSTALQLLARFYEPREGVVTVGGVDLTKVGEASYRQLTALVNQDAFFFDATVRDNLVLDREDVTEEQLQEAAKQAKIHEAIQGWPDGYDTRIREGGGTLSGGERQRLSIARAVLRRPSLLLLDEVTSALDPATEAEINELILRLRPNRTIVSVTHRLASAVEADQIHVFDEGRIVESGTHQELLQRRGLYCRLWEKQNGFRLSEDGLHASVEAERLSKLPFFEGIELAPLRGLAGLFATETFQEGDLVVREGEEGNKFYIIVRGIFEVLKSDRSGGEKRVAMLQDGDYFGEIALLKGIPRTASVRAAGPSVLLSMRREAFRQLTADFPQVLASLERTLQARMEAGKGATK